MSDPSETTRRSAPRRVTSGIITCPACAGPLKPDAQWCPACNFTGGDSMVIFPDPPPPLLPILDAAGIFKDRDLRKIESARDAVSRRFPQFQWRICSVGLPRETRLSLFGFWLLNACPFHENETLEERAWTILLLVNADTGQAAVIPGYAAEPFLSDDEWKTILATMAESWRAGKPADAIVRFFNGSREQLNRAWRRFGSRHAAK
ncbi:MAG: TPM domain-containing protein [Luteolibacter sp.]|uniref:TPM domain-containing protein n=1 Tax=Luteolibacter sp. TaxID=1962973 RepID=UPI003263BB67